MATLDTWIDAHARHTPDATAIRFEGERWSYSALADQVARCATTLARLEVGAGDRIVWLGQNHPQLLTLLFAAARLGAVLSPINWRLSTAEMQHVIDDATPRVLFADAAMAGGADTLIAANPTLTRWDVETTAWDDTTGTPHTAAPVDPHAPLLLVYTSGTTGLPKGAMLSQHALQVNAWNAVHMHGMSAADRVLSVLPMFHVGGLNIQTTPALYCGAEVLLHRRFEPAATLGALADDRPSLCVLVPATIQALAGQPNWQVTPVDSLRMLTTGSSIVPLETLAVFEDRGVPVVQVYGCTETGPVSAYQTLNHRNHASGTTGRAALHSALRIVDRDGAPCPPGTSGEIVVLGEHILSGYWNNPEASTDALRHGGFATGDVGYLDADGDLHVQDRARDLIISGGENVYPAEVERVLRTVPGVRDVAVTAVPDDTWGQVPAAWLIVDAATYSEDTARAQLHASLARFKHPRDWHVVADFPRNALGKVQKFALTPP
ncbi:MAG: AMP-binding protein [Pseudomonadota bacterium]